MTHPGRYLQQRLKEKGRTQKDFARLLGKKVSEVNELIKGKRNITVQWDILLSALFGDEEQKWCRLQLAYDYTLGKGKVDQKRLEELKLMAEPVEANAVENTNNETMKQGLILDRGNNETMKQSHEIFRNF